MVDTFMSENVTSTLLLEITRCLTPKCPQSLTKCPRGRLAGFLMSARIARDLKFEIQNTGHTQSTFRFPISYLWFQHISVFRFQILDSRFQILDFRFQIFYFGFQIFYFGFQIFYSGFHIWDISEFQNLDLGFWISDFGYQQISDFGFQIMDFRFWISVFWFRNTSDLRF